MAFDVANLADGKWLDLHEATTYLALGEAVSIKALRRLHYPSARIWLPQIKSTWEGCRDEARGVSGGYSEFLKLIDSYSQYPFHPPPSGLFRDLARWPPSGRFLYELILNWEQAHDQDESARLEKEPLILEAFLSQDVLFRGHRNGCEKSIELLRTPIFDFYISTIEASAGEPERNCGRALKWTGVHLELGSLMEQRGSFTAKQDHQPRNNRPLKQA